MMYQAIFNAALNGRGETRRWGRRLRRLILKGRDPVVHWEINGRKLELPLSHQLPFYRREFPTYAANLERLAAAIRRELGCLAMIDVGANIGDSVALAAARDGDTGLLIEGDKRYFELLKRNTAALDGVVCVSTMLSDAPGKVPVRLVTSGGTGQVIDASAGQHALVSSLDCVVKEYPQFRQCNLLKIDVDGYDFRVLRGAAELVRAAQPVLFFEQDPALLDQAKEDADAVWDWLVQAGYTSLFIYDHLGFWVGAFPLADTTFFRQLNAYSRQRPGYYYDVAAFASSHRALEKTFAAGENAFYAGQRRAKNPG
jgi:FkbM family methyltransferase